jgi:hypothetical protein
MARIPQEQIEGLKQEILVQRLAETMGIQLKRHGVDLIGLCPFHDDKTPSLVINPKKNLWHCLGACQAGGSVIRLGNEAGAGLVPPCGLWSCCARGAMGQVFPFALASSFRIRLPVE